MFSFLTPLLGRVTNSVVRHPALNPKQKINTYFKLKSAWNILFWVFFLEQAIVMRSRVKIYEHLRKRFHFSASR